MLSSVLSALRLTALLLDLADSTSLCQGVLGLEGIVSPAQRRVVIPTTEMVHGLLLTTCRCCHLSDPEGKDEDRVLQSEVIQTPFICSLERAR